MSKENKIVSDVPLHSEKHREEFVNWAKKAKHVPAFYSECFKCSRNIDHLGSCPHLGETVTSEEPCPDFIRHFYMPNCGMCAAYKTPFCSFHAMEGYIIKADAPCADFFLDRHLTKEGELRGKTRRLTFQQKVENL